MGKHKSSLQESLQLFKHANAIGQSRREARADGSRDWKIFHSTTFKEYVGGFARVLKYTRSEFGVQQVRDLQPEHITAFFKSLTDRNLAGSTIDKYVAVINKADAVAHKIGWRDDQVAPLVRAEPKGPRLTPAPKPYTTEEANRIVETLGNFRDRRFEAIAQIQRGAGLRVDEAICLRAIAISPDGSKLTLEAADGTKKGRPREVLVRDDKTRQTLIQWRNAAETSGRARLFIKTMKDSKALVRAYQRSVEGVTKEMGLDHSKTHDLRRTFVAERYEQYLADGMSRSEVLAQLSADLGHGRSRMERGLLASYLASFE